MNPQPHYNMDRHFLLPLTIAAAMHGLLFGLPRGKVPEKAPRPNEPREETLRIRLEQPSEPVPVDDLVNAAAGASDPVSRLTEPLPSQHESPFVVPVVERQNISPGPLDRIPFDSMAPGAGPFSEGPGGPNGIFTKALLDKSPNARVQIAPTYPPSARQEGKTGEVVVEFVVDEGGRVLQPRVVRSTDRVFEEPAVRAVERWRFEPGRYHGNPVRFRMALPIVFSLNETT